MGGWLLAWLPLLGCGGGGDAGGHRNPLDPTVTNTGGQAAANAGTSGTGVSLGGQSQAGTAGIASGGTSQASAGTPAGGAAEPPAGFDENLLIPSRIRRLTNAEYDASVKALFATKLELLEDLAPDARQAGFTVNDSQRVDPVLAKQYSAAAEELAAEVMANVDSVAPCSNTVAEAESCAQEFIESFGARVYRRPLVAEETEGLLTVYRAGAQDASYADGIGLVVRALTQSAGFLYLTELGDGPPDATVALTPYELASQMSYLLTAAPPDQALVEAALNGGLDAPEGRETEALRLLRSGSLPEARVVRILREWLGTDRIDQIAKDTNVYPEFDNLKAAMVAESQEFISASINAGHSATLTELLSAPWTVADADLAQFYGASGSGEVDLPERRGILNQGAFLSVYAHAHESAPVLRGVAVARRIACLDIPSPSTQNIDTTPPVPDPTQTTRERYTAHVADPQCASCHSNIDPFGFTFEQFDGMGRYREADNGLPVDSTSTISVGADFDGEYADSNELAEALAVSPTVKNCFARHMFRAMAARSDDSVRGSEDAFVQSWGELSDGERDQIITTLVAFIKSPLFTHRRAQ